MKQIKIKYTWRELADFAKSAALSLVTGLFRLLWAVILLVINIFVWCVSELVKAIKAAPVVAFFIMLTLMTVALFAVYAQMKYKLTTAEWERDSLEQRLDSVKVLYGNNVQYFRYQNYKEK